MSLTSKGSQDICFNALNALKEGRDGEGENRLKPGTQSYTVARTCTDGDARWQATLPGQKRGEGGGGELVRGGAKQQTGFGNSAPCVALSVRSPTIFQ